MNHNRSASQPTVDASKAKDAPDGSRGQHKPWKKRVPKGRSETATVDDTRSPPDKTERKEKAVSASTEKETRAAPKSKESASAQREAPKKTTVPPPPPPSHPKNNLGSRPETMTNKPSNYKTQPQQKGHRGYGWKNRKEEQQKNGDDGASVNNKNPQPLPKPEPKIGGNFDRQAKGRGRAEPKVDVPKPIDNPNGLHFLPWRGREKLAIEIESDHPWEGKYHDRVGEALGKTSTPCSRPAPLNYSSDKLLKCPDWENKGRNPAAPQMITMKDVVAFRAKTAKKWNVGSKKDKNNSVEGLTAAISTLSMSKKAGPVIYRYTAAVNNSLGILEAIHFELFMPNRADLRFLAIALFRLPSGTLEGDFFLIDDVHLLTYGSSLIQLGGTDYPVVWKATRFRKMDVAGSERQGLAYVIQHSKTADVSLSVSPLVDCEFSLAGSLYTDSAERKEHSLVMVTMRDTSSAHLYPVEAPFRREYERLQDMHKGKAEVPEPKKPSWYLQTVSGVRTTSQLEGSFPCRVEALSREERQKIDDRLADFKLYDGRNCLKLMHDLFVMGSLFRLSAGKSKEKEMEDDCVELQVDESIILRTLRLRDGELGDGGYQALLDLVYKWNQKKPQAKYLDTERHTVVKKDKSILTLNHQQSRAVRHYTGGERAFCILSPPGSGKTTVAAAMAAAVACDKASKGVQLLVAVQNVAVDNIGAALTGFRHKKEVYNVKSTMRLDPHKPAPYDYFDGMDTENLGGWQSKKERLAELKKKNPERLQKAEDDYEKSLSEAKRDYEKGANPSIVLSTVEMVLAKMFNRKSTFSWKVLSRVNRVIIDEASLLTEAALYCLFRRFPQADFVFIGDDQQLPPFMFESKILGHELAGRSALSVVMKNGNIPVIPLDEVYRAPPSLAEPYNRLSYGGRLISRKPEESSGLLSRVHLIPPSRPQLLFVDVNGKQERNKQSKSLYNEMEKKALLNLLKKLPSTWKEDIMIICLYKEQKKKLEEALGTGYTILTVDSSQGKEKPIVILLTTRTEQAIDMGFFCCQKRCTVAISRQQRALIILGQTKILTTNHPWSTVVNGDDFTRIDGESLVRKQVREKRFKEGERRTRGRWNNG